MSIIGRAMLCIPLAILSREEEAQDLGTKEADDEADHDAGEGAVVAGGVGTEKEVSMPSLRCRG